MTKADLATNEEIKKSLISAFDRIFAPKMSSALPFVNLVSSVTGAGLDSLKRLITDISAEIDREGKLDDDEVQDDFSTLDITEASPAQELDVEVDASEVQDDERLVYVSEHQERVLEALESNQQDEQAFYQSINLVDYVPYKPKH